MLNVIESIRMRLKRRVGCFGLYGYDFMIDENMKVWLIEINVNPALTTNTQTLIQAIPPVVRESICKFISPPPLSFFNNDEIFIVISIECFEKIRHSQRIFPIKSLKGFKCIYNELERKGSLPYIEQKRATSSSPNTKKVLPPAPPPPVPLPSSSTAVVRSNNRNSPKLYSKTVDQENVRNPKSIISYQLRQSEDRQRLKNSIDIEDPLIVKYQSIQRHRTHFEILKPATIIAEEWKNLDRTQKNRLSLGGSKTLVLISKSSTQNKSIQPLQT